MITRIGIALCILGVMLPLMIVYVARELFPRHECVVRWQASSTQIIGGKQTKPAFTSNCNSGGKP